MRSKCRILAKQGFLPKPEKTSGGVSVNNKRLYNPPAQYTLRPSSLLLTQISLELLSELFEVKIIVYSVFHLNKSLFASTINRGFMRKIEMVSSSWSEGVFYGSLFHPDFLREHHGGVGALIEAHGDLVSPGKRKLSDIQRENDMVKDEMMFNLLVFDKLLLRFNIVAKPCNLG